MPWEMQNSRWRKGIRWCHWNWWRRQCFSMTGESSSFTCPVFKGQGIIIYWHHSWGIPMSGVPGYSWSEIKKIWEKKKSLSKTRTKLDQRKQKLKTNKQKREKFGEREHISVWAKSQGKLEWEVKRTLRSKLEMLDRLELHFTGTKHHLEGFSDALHFRTTSPLCEQNSEGFTVHHKQ